MKALGVQWYTKINSCPCGTYSLKWQIITYVKYKITTMIKAMEKTISMKK